MAPSRTRLTDAEWLQQRPYIRRMIIDQNISQEEARQRLKDKGILVSKAQLEYKLKFWGFRKKAPKKQGDAVWQFIGHRVAKRDRQGKASDVFLNGRLLDPAKVRKEINRHQPTSLVRLERGGTSPKTPELSEIFIRTPASTQLQPLWPACLPWLQFQKRLSHALVPLKPPVASTNASIKTLAYTGRYSVYSMSHSLVRPTETGSYSLAGDLDAIMPEAHEDENARRAQVLLHGSAVNVTAEHLKVVLYQVSNKLGSFNIAHAVWISIVAVIEESGVTKMLLQLESLSDFTLQSVAESLFQQAFRQLDEDKNSLRSKQESSGSSLWDDIGEWDIGQLEMLPSWRIINWLLSSGQNPNTPIRLEQGGCLTPLQMAVDIGCPQLIHVLLDAKSGPNLTYDDPDIPARRLLRGRHISSADKIQVLKRFSKDAASVSFSENEQPGSLPKAMLEGLEFNRETPNLELLDFLIDDEPENYLEYRSLCPLGWVSQTCNILGYAASLSNESAATSCLSHFLRRAHQLKPSLPPTRFIASDVILLAAWKGHNKVLEFLRGLGVDLTLRGHRGITALHVAAFYGHLEICQTLLGLRIPVDGHLDSQHLPSPLHLAACGGQLSIIEFLHGHGAELTRTITLDEERRWGVVIGERPTGMASPIEAAITHCYGPGLEFFANKGFKFPPWAVHYGVFYVRGPQFLQLALKMGADPNWTKDGLSALQLVLKQKTVWGQERRMAHAAEVAMILLDAGAVLTEDDIRQAIKLSNWALIDRLLEKDHVGIWQREEYMLLLMAAIASDKQHLVTEVFKRFPNAYTAGALCASVFFEEDNFGIVRQLLENRPQQDDVTPIESLAIGIAAWRCREELLDLLLARLRKPSPAALPIENFMRLQEDRRPIKSLGATYNLMSIDRAGKRLFWEDRIKSLGSPLVMALHVMSENCLLRLLAHGFLPDRLTMSCAAQFDDPGQIRRLRVLTRYPMVFPGYETLEGPLTVSVKHERMDKVQVLLLYGNHSIDESNHLVYYGRSPLQMAAEIGNLDLIHMLLDAGADVNSPAAQSYGATALQIAAIKGHLGVAKILVDLGANVNAPGATGEGGRTALEGAAEHGRIDTIQYLLSQGVETNAKGRIPYLRAIRYAELEGHMAAAKLLKTWREWAADDDALWDKLQSLPKDECERFTEKDFEDQSDSNSESERHSLRKASAGGGMQHLVFDDAPAAEAHIHESSVTANPAGGIISELEDLEMMTSDTFAFWSEV